MQNISNLINEEILKFAQKVKKDFPDSCEWYVSYIDATTKLAIFYI